jgi:hypothetical protein
MEAPHSRYRKEDYEPATQEIGFPRAMVNRVRINSTRLVLLLRTSLALVNAHELSK